MTRPIPVHYLKEDSVLDAELVHLMPDSERWSKLTGFGAHIDDCFTVIVVSKGSGTTDVDFHTVRLSEGQLGIIAPGQVHSNIYVHECEAWMLRISPDMIDPDYHHLIDEYSMSPNPVGLSEEAMTNLCDALRLLERLMASMGSGKLQSTVVFNMLNVVLGIITPEIMQCRAGLSRRAGEISIRFRRMLPQFIRQQKRPSFYAGRLCISEVYLNEVLKKSTGLSPSEWITATIILEAKRLLRSTALSAKEVAHELGFEDTAYFSRFFKKNTRMTPLEFRRSILS